MASGFGLIRQGSVLKIVSEFESKLCMLHQSVDILIGAFKIA